MRNEELIKRLQQLDPNAEVVLVSSNFELNNAIVSVECVSNYETALKTKKTFRDEFDGDNYSKTVFKIMGGNQNIIFVS